MHSVTDYIDMPQSFFLLCAVGFVCFPASIKKEEMAEVWCSFIYVSLLE